MALRIPIYFLCLSRWFLCAWCFLVEGLASARVFPVTPWTGSWAPQFFDSSSCWDGLRCEAFSCLAKTNLEQSSLCPVGAGRKETRKRANHVRNNCATSRELVLYGIQDGGAAQRCVQGGLQVRASSGEQDCVTGHHALGENHLCCDACTGEAECKHSYVVGLQTWNNQPLVRPIEWCSLAVLQWINTSHCIKCNLKAFLSEAVSLCFSAEPFNPVPQNVSVLAQKFNGEPPDTALKQMFLLS